ncbi:TRAP transporter small permease [Paracoccus albus]|uniref:TRAP transporter small permease n=1 Tax=Paracoccus albus TaxID=3017784 RepID=UPI0022F092C5|nr:TRAP transporter small permease [Paracoccus albus]WBU59934.1 TRAP transporter small permease [Paracoccus albus]
MAELPQSEISGPLQRLSAGFAWAEARLTGLMILTVLALLLANVVSRAFGRPLIWTDELAVYLMVVGAFAGASLGIANREHLAVTLLADRLGPGAQKNLLRVVDTVLLAILLIFGWTLWNWFDLPGVIAAESMSDYARDSFNFMYQEPTTTLGIRKLWFWLIMPFFCFSGLIHVAARFGKPAPDKLQ